MEEEKAAAYYEELTRKGGGAAKFKQGLGFSSSSSSDPFSSANKTTHFSLSSFVRASSPKLVGGRGDGDGDDDDKYSSKKTLPLASISKFVRASSPKREDRWGDHARVLDSIHDKLNRRRSPPDERERRREKRERRDEDEERYSSRKSRHRDSDRDMDSERSRRRSRSYSPPHRVSRGRDRDRDRDGDMDGDRDRARRGDTHRSSKDRRSGGSKSERPVDYDHLIEGYSKMTPAERVKAKMKLQLSQTAAKDTAIGVNSNSGWERFDFNKEAPLDDDEDATETAGDDISVVKDIGRSFRFSAVEARREEAVKAAHDQAIFGGGPTSSSVNLRTETDTSSRDNEESDDIEVINNENNVNSTSLISDKVISMQRGSWRDRARRLQNGLEGS